MLEAGEARRWQSFARPFRVVRHELDHFPARGTFARLILLGAVDEHAMLQRMAKQFETEGDWAWGVAKSHQELDEADWEFWRSRSPDERLAATFQASFDAWMLHDGNRLDGIDLTAFGVRKLGTDVEERP